MGDLPIIGDGHPMVIPWHSHDIKAMIFPNGHHVIPSIWPRNPLQKSAENSGGDLFHPIHGAHRGNRGQRHGRGRLSDVHRGCESRAGLWGLRPGGTCLALTKTGPNLGSWEMFRWSKTGKTLEKCWLFEWWKLLDVGKSNGKWWNVNGISIGMWWNNIMVLMCFDVILMGIQWEFIFNNVGWIYQQHCGIPWEHLLDI